jgi:uncharacterized iron-regulated protein
MATIESYKTVPDKPAYRLFDKEGKEIVYGSMLDVLTTVDIILFGEIHNDPIDHWLQFELAKDLFSLGKRTVIIGAEMFEADDQLILDEYLAGLISHEHLVKEAKIWDNYDTDYRPIVTFAQQHGIRFIATNIPRRYASLVAREGLKALECLSDEAKRWIAPLPIRLDLMTPTYKDILDLSMTHGIEPENFLSAQAVRDATMASFILGNRTPGSLFLHYHGEYHSRKYGGIYWYLKQAEPNLTMTTIISIEEKTIEFREEHLGLGDYLLITPHSMTKTS